MNEQIYAGIDVAKHHFIVGLSGRKQTKALTHNPKGIQQAVEYLKKFAHLDVIVLQSTEGLGFASLNLPPESGADLSFRWNQALYRK